MQKSFLTPGPVSLYVEVGSGGVIVHTDEVTETVVDVNGKHADEVIVEQRGDEIVVIARQRGGSFLGRGSDVDVHVSAPYDSRLVTKLGSADLRVMGRIGESMLRSGSGDVTLEDSSGDVFVESGSGDVEADELRGDLRVKCGSGDVSVDRVEGSATVSTGSGDVRVGAATGSLQVKSGSGDLTIDDAQHDVVLNTASGDLYVGQVHRGQLTARNVSGDIRVGVPAGIPVWTDISTMTGSVRSSLEGAGEPAEGQDFIELRAKSVSGDISLEQL
ncbi:MAG: DUF4097 family beta strand repeat protein [Nocardioidaceae bacterium]|nr:DUF4097 family beta strand repeat protein [Nocardioidaceae bacterium]NUS53232.1 DUF4097 family beta strand repeat protein [Nocardioidaceae bacterium]